MHERSPVTSSALDGARTLGFERYLVVVGGVLVALFVLLDPSASAGLSLTARIAFWTLHAFVGLLLLAWVQGGLGRFDVWRRRPWATTAVSGLLGALTFAPVALGLESLLGLAAEPDDDVLDAWATRHGLLGEVTIEALELAPIVTVTWLAVNLPWLLRLDFTTARSLGAAAQTAVAVDRTRRSEEDDVDALTTPPEPNALDPPSAGLERTSQAEHEVTVAPAAVQTVDSGRDPDRASIDDDGPLLARLPSALGTDVVALRSQLHYLEVFTDRGRALVLYNLRDAIAEIGARDGGLRVHRSHWVADRHVRRLRRRGSGWIVELSTGLELPISRRLVSSAKDRWGDAATYAIADA
ncbi:MAG: LytTR family DNA-binding domain-containing protein [Acidobacteriota bacterium]